MSKNALGSVTLGSTDPVAIANATDLDDNGVVSGKEKGIYSYNNAVETLVMECVEESGVKENLDGINVLSIRSIGNTDMKYTSQGLIGNDSRILDTTFRL